MKLAIQIISWITIAICGLMMLSEMGPTGDGDIVLGSLMFGILPILNVIYLKNNK